MQVVSAAMNSAPSVTVFVVFSVEELPAPIDIRSAALFLSREEPRWSIGSVGIDSLRLGRYGQTPVVVTLQHGAAVLEESRAMSKRLSQIVPHGRTELASGTTRFELHWNLRCDPEVAAETALLVVGCAQALARLTGGVALVEGKRVVDKQIEFSFGQAYSILFVAEGQHLVH